MLLAPLSEINSRTLNELYFDHWVIELITISDITFNVLKTKYINNLNKLKIIKAVEFAISFVRNQGKFFLFGSIAKLSAWNASVETFRLCRNTEIYFITCHSLTKKNLYSPSDLFFFFWGHISISTASSFQTMQITSFAD